MVEPVLKWAGGKRQLLDELTARFPANHDRYHEPFLGGGAVFFDREPVGGTVNDTNPRLVNFYEQVRDDPDGLVRRLRSYDDPGAEPDPTRAHAETDHKGKRVETYYYQQRALFNRRPYTGSFDAREEAALLLYLNRTCYNGLYRENSRGGFNVPVGRYSNPDWVQADRIRAASRVLDHTDLFNRDFGYVTDHATPGDVVYFDPPYQPMSATASFTEYSAAGFSRDDQERLLHTAKELDDSGVSVVLSNSGVLYDRYDEAGFFVGTEDATRAINSDGESRDAVEEIIATNVPVASRRAGQRSLVDF